jgi:Tol biopolymer transport system component
MHLSARLCLFLAVGASASAGEDPRIAALAREVAGKGWIAFSARGESGTWDIFLCRPDGSALRNLTSTPESEEAAPLFSRDGKKMLFRRIPRGTQISHDLWGFQGKLVISEPDGSKPVEVGADREFAWASWSPDATRIACLTKKDIQIVDVATKAIVRTLPRQGIYQQLFWSPDGKWFTGTANNAGEQWCVVRMDAETGAVNPVLRFQSCTPDWFPDGKRVIFSSRPENQSPTNSYGWTQLYAADGEGKNVELVYGEDGYHIYGGALSPDGAYVLFTACPEDGGGSEKEGAPLRLLRRSDAPTIAGPSPDLRRKHPKTKDGPTLTLHRGWEPCWTFAEIPSSR